MPAGHGRNVRGKFVVVPLQIASRLPDAIGELVIGERGVAELDDRVR
jgi:hypothetical protein